MVEGKKKLGRKQKYFQNDNGKYSCHQCASSYDSKHCLMQHIRLKHKQYRAVDQAYELIRAKQKTQNQILELFRSFTERIAQITDAFSVDLESECTHVEKVIDNIERLSKLSTI